MSVMFQDVLYVEGLKYSSCGHMGEQYYDIGVNVKPHTRTRTRTNTHTNIYRDTFITENTVRGARHKHTHTHTHTHSRRTSHTHTHTHTHSHTRAHAHTMSSQCETEKGKIHSFEREYFECQKCLTKHFY
jgi:hypothetical protein